MHTGLDWGVDSLSYFLKVNAHHHWKLRYHTQASMSDVSVSIYSVFVSFLGGGQALVREEDR